jgi:hypothetical protein
MLQVEYFITQQQTVFNYNKKSQRNKRNIYAIIFIIDIN